MNLHERLIIFDGLNVLNFGPEVFQAMHQGGVTAANCTCSIWEDFSGSVKAIAEWKSWLSTYANLLLPVRCVSDIRRAKSENKVGIVLGWQNATGFGDYLPFVSIFKELGLGIVQLTYNTATSVGSGCYESHDGGLTDFGRELVAEMNRVGILIDLSHVGARTADDAIRSSAKPVAYSHCCPSALKTHPRNKSDAQLRVIAERGGLVGVTMFPAFLKNGAQSTLPDYVDTIAYVLDVVGEDHVGIGTDFTEGHGPDFFRYIVRDKGHARALTQFAATKMPAGFERIVDFPRLTEEMERRGWPDARIAKIMGENWLRLLGDVWGA